MDFFCVNHSRQFIPDTVTWWFHVFFFSFFFLELGRGLNLLVLGNVRCCLSLPKDTKGSMTSMKIVPVPHEKRSCIPSNNKVIK